MRVEWECNGEKGGFPCCDGAFCVGIRFSLKGHTASSIMDAFEYLGPEKWAHLGIECHTVDQILPNGAALCACILSSDVPLLREITHRYAGKAYVEITTGGARIAVVNELRNEQMEG